jgi:prophage antirepressor-like protein
MNELTKVFTYQENEVRTIMKDGEPWFVAKDVCDILELERGTRAVERLDEDEVRKTYIMDAMNRQQEMYIVSEPGLYVLVLASIKPEAKKFKRWITHEVLPSIRKHGMYAVDELLDNPDLAIKAFTALKEEREKNRALESENNLLAKRTLTWTSRKVLEAIVKTYGKAKDNGRFGYADAWKEFKRELLYKHGINLNSRISKQNLSAGKKPRTLDTIHDDELSTCISVAVSLCRASHVDIKEVLEKGRDIA